MQTSKKTVSAYRLDPKVIITMCVVALVSIGIFSFRLMSNKPCKEVTILPDAVNSKLLESGDFETFTEIPVRFSSTATESDKSEWSFGDGSGKILTGKTVVYTYTEPGQYVVELTINGQCKEFKYITVKKTPKLIDPDLVPHIIVSALEIELGKEVVFTDSTKKATQWEWRFGESGRVDDVKQTTQYTFLTSGVKTVTLVINGNPDLNTTVRIYVKDKALPPGQMGGALPNIGDAVKPKPETEPINLANRPPAITDQQFSAMLEDVVKGKQFASSFSVYLCDYLKLPVKYKVEGDKEKTMSFEEMCTDLKGMRRVKKVITRLNIQESTGCIIDAWIKVDRRTF